ncbi:NEL-type E3 ubiquitin ligase domain-containing protein [Pseudomonas sp. PSKL.D1]|uniref:NEL-type E3 ubiquitin ligase domain-containing protein n=1 Tax=Pseudomonas sp. PSKL.D1 TaxID=3029060 RepID=UPI002381814F|nr:NEL-type E3 ubiquitin ligase domain-containing protein [Pseudomonas sp. PSKL.D1]WDY59724.1 NEL-type E3 ubiquitin ligase domain-containing protein [Pseudomonas sp. PSKL.D1]
MKPVTRSLSELSDIQRSQGLTDTFIRKRLPTWLTQVPVNRLGSLHEAILAHDSAARALAQATEALEAPQHFAERLFQPLLGSVLPQGVALDDVQWLEKWYVPSSIISTPTVEEHSLRTSVLLRMMQNFPQVSAPFDNTGITLAGQDSVLVSDSKIIEPCRTLDAGKQYQAALDQVFTAGTLKLLADHERLAFAMAVELALCAQRITPAQYDALSPLWAGGTDDPQQQLFASAGELTLLGYTVNDALKIQLRDADGASQGVMLYVPDDPQQALRSFESLPALSQYLVASLADTAQQRLYRNRVRLRDRSGFQHLLQTRLSDETPDLQVDGIAPVGGLFSTLAKSHVERLKDDGRLLLVSTADADRNAAMLQLKAWEEVGLTALGLAGFAVPAVGLVLFGAMVVDTLGHAFEGVRDWREGHQHEAHEHLFKVAETVAITAATAAGVGVVAYGFRRSAFVDALEPVNTDQGARLWLTDLQEYESEPENPQLQDNGLYAVGTRRWLRIEERYYEVHQEAPGKAWRLRHATDPNRFGPAVDFNGERCWRIRSERPLEWSNAPYMLNRLWPMSPALDAETAQQVLRVTGTDVQTLRGVLVENRPVPVNLRDTMRRLMAARRVDGVFEQLQSASSMPGDAQVLAWCKAHDAMQALDEPAMVSYLKANRAQLRPALLQHLAEGVPLHDETLGLQPDPLAPTDDLQLQLRRMFPGLPRAYVDEALADIDPALQTVAGTEGRVPQTVMTRAAALLSTARLTRALEGLLLGTDYNDGTGELVMALLPRLDNWPLALNIELRESTPYGRLITVIDPQGAADERSILVWREGQFHLYDSHGMELEAEIKAPGELYQALLALMNASHRQTLGLTGEDPAQQLRQAIIDKLPAHHDKVLARLGWRAPKPWFNPLTRLSGGRVGYPLGGSLSRPMGMMESLRRRVRTLYPALSVAEVDTMIVEWIDEGLDPYEELLAEELNYGDLDDVLTRWERAAQGYGLRARRRQFSNRLRAAWRYEGEVVNSADGRTTGRLLSIEGWRVGTLPGLPANVDFSHVYELRMSGMDLESIPAYFLRCFQSVHSLNLNNNLLISIPAEIARLPNLRTLELRSNRIRMDAAGVETLSGLSRLQTLVLDYNPLRTLDLDFARLAQLTTLRANRCSLRNLPQGLERAPQLALVDLRFNHISLVPDAVLAMPRGFRRGINLEGNQLAMGDIAQLLAADEPEPEPVIADQPTRDQALQRWLETGATELREPRRAIWQRVEQLPGSSALFQLLGRLTQARDYSLSPAYIGNQVWELLQQLNLHEPLRSAIFDHAGEQLTCHDSVAERFSRLWLRALVRQARHLAATGRGGIQYFDLGRALFRMDRLDAFALHEVARREAAGQVVDELEVVLALRISLASRLGLVGQPRSMLFRGIANITPELEQQAFDTVMAEEGRGMLAENLSGREFWRDYLKLRHAALFERYLSPFTARGSALEDQQEAGELSEQGYLEAYNALGAEREAAEHHLMRLLSREAVELRAEGAALDLDESDNSDASSEDSEDEQ